MDGICPRCQHSNKSEAKYCENCGFPLLVPRATATTRIPTITAPELVHTEPERTPTPFTEDGSLTLVIDDTSVPVSMSQRVVLGRKTAESSPSLVDLSQFSSYQRGVSRNHAALERVGDHLELVDLASVNGTFINDKRLLPRKGYVLQDGDQIKLGALVIILRLNSAE